MIEREILSKTYLHTVNIYRFQSNENEDGSILEKKILIFKNLKCALSKTSMNEAVSDDNRNLIKQSYLIFLSDEYEIKAFDVAEIDGKFYTLGESIIYKNSHQEIKARLEHGV